MPAGRPLKFKTAEELQKKIDEYFETTPREEWAITGLALHLDTSRKTLCEYEKSDGYSEELSNAVKRGKEKVEFAYELRLIKRGNGGDIFALKNFDWVDKQEVETKSLNLNKDVSGLSDEELLKILKG